MERKAEASVAPNAETRGGMVAADVDESYLKSIGSNGTSA
jgi:hypothetical protein